MAEVQEQINLLTEELADLRHIISKKTGLGSSNIKGNIVAPSNIAGTIGAGEIDSAGMFGSGVVDQAAIGANAAGQSELKTEQVNVTVSSGNPSGTASVTSGSIVLGYYSTGNQDQFVDNVSISGTTLTITLAANATANNTFTVTLLKT